MSEAGQPAGAAQPSPPMTANLLPLLIIGQVALHAAMAGQRLASPLQALAQGHSAWVVGILLALFAAAPVLTAMGAGRLSDRHGYHRLQRVAVVCTLLGVGCAELASWLSATPQLLMLGVGACFSGTGANAGLIAIQRTAGQMARTSTERMRVFSWLGMAPALANALGSVSAGLLIDHAGFAGAYAVMLLLPLLSLASARRVPASPARPLIAGGRSAAAWGLLAAPGLRRLLFVSWLLSASWDVHNFAVPVLGHARGYSATTIGLVLGIFTAAVTVVRLLIPLLAHRLDEVQVLRGAMLLAGAAFALYPFAGTPWLMAGCATLLGLALGAVQPMIMSSLHQLTPEHRHGEAIALRSVVMNFSSSLMPVAFGLVGAALGPGVVFWLMSAAVGAGSWATPGLRKSMLTSALPSG